MEFSEKVKINRFLTQQKNILMFNPFVSIIVRTKNEDFWIGKCLNEIFGSWNVLWRCWQFFFDAGDKSFSFDTNFEKFSYEWDLACDLKILGVGLIFCGLLSQLQLWKSKNCQSNSQLKAPHTWIPVRSSSFPFFLMQF